MMRSIIYSIVFVGIITVLAGPGVAQVSELAGREWRLVELNGERVRASRADLRIDADGLRFSGNAGCNRMFGRVSVGARSIRFAGIGTTKMLCTGADVMRRETTFLAALRRTTRYRVSARQLMLFAGSRLEARFRSETAEPDARPEGRGLSLEDRKWVLESVAGQSLPSLQEEAFVVFDPEKGGAGGNSSCNVFGGNYKVSGSEIRITQTISTMRACIEDRRAEVERIFLDGLREADRYDIRSDRLMLYQGRKRLLTFKGQKRS